MNVYVLSSNLIMKITLQLSKAELDLIEEALVQYLNLLLKTEEKNQLLEHELKLCQRVFEELGIEDLEVDYQQDSLPFPNQYPYSR